MKKTLMCGAIAAALGLLSVAAWAQRRQKQPGEDWAQLFNGEDLSGWTKIGKESWSVGTA